MSGKIDLPLLGWDNDRNSQELWIRIEKWQYKIFVESLRSHRTTFQFDGIVPDWPAESKGIKVVGDIEVPIEIEYPDKDEPPPDSQGFLHLVKAPDEPFLGVHLYCSRDTYHELFRAFSTAFSNVGTVGLQLHLQQPQDAEEGFWKTGWHERQVNISEFWIGIGGQKANQSWMSKVFS